MAIALVQTKVVFAAVDPVSVTFDSVPGVGSLLTVCCAPGDHDAGSLGTPAGWASIFGRLKEDGTGGAGGAMYGFEKVSAGAADQTFTATDLGPIGWGLVAQEWSLAGSRQAAATTLEDESQTTADMSPGAVTPNAGAEALILTFGVYFAAYRSTNLAGCILDVNRDRVMAALPAPPAAGTNPAMFVAHRIVPSASGSYTVGAHNEQTTQKFVVATMIYSGAGAIRAPIGGEPGGSVL